jgi:hypothetical protein
MRNLMEHLRVSDRIEETGLTIKKYLNPSMVRKLGTERMKEKKKGETRKLLDNSNLAKGGDQR